MEIEKLIQHHHNPEKLRAHPLPSSLTPSGHWWEFKLGILFNELQSCGMVWVGRTLKRI